MIAVPLIEAPIARGRREGLASRLMTILTSGWRHQTFLGNPLLPLLIRATPPARRRALAIRLLGISPHYFTERDSVRYAGLPPAVILEKELERNIVSRRILCADVVAPYLSEGMTALDFGCGAGILAAAMAARCRSVVAVDISAGALSCGGVLFPLENLRFGLIARGRIEGVADASVDLVTAIAVIQHMTDAELDGTFAEFARILVPGGRALCHVPLKETAAATPAATLHADRRNPLLRRLQKQYGLLMLYRDRDALEAMAARHGLSIETAAVIGTLSAIEDDIAHQQLFVLVRERTAEAP